MEDMSVKNNEYRILPGIEKVIYGTNELHRLLFDDNTGDNGENITIAVLSCERSAATIKMMDSIRENMSNFKGKYLIGDNGSSKETINEIKSAFDRMPFECKIIEFGENLGVAKGRNELFAYVDTEWIMSLDNDMVFVTNILKEIKNTVSKLGCNFVNLPLLNENANQIFSMGGHMFLERITNGIHIGCGGAFEQISAKPGQEVPRTLSTFLFGGASIFKKSSFEECGRFDEGMFVGFEDIDFSINIFKKGYKIGTIGVLGLIHDHKKPENQNDIEYERQRYSNVKLLKSAMYFENKHKYKIWNEGTEQWLKERERELGIVQEEDKKEEKVIKKNIIMVIDSRESKYYEKYFKLKDSLEKEYEIKEIFLEDIENNTEKLIFAIQKTDIVYFIDDNILELLDEKVLYEYIDLYGYNKEYFIEVHVKNNNIVIGTNKNIKNIKFLDVDIETINNDNIIEELAKR